MKLIRPSYSTNHLAAQTKQASRCFYRSLSLTGLLFIIFSPLPDFPQQFDHIDGKNITFI